MQVDAEVLLRAAQQAGFELAGLTRALPHEDFSKYKAWTEAGFAADMKYLTDHRGEMRSDPRTLLPGARTILCVAKLYQSEGPDSHQNAAPDEGWISRYAWGNMDYHDVLRNGLERLLVRLREILPEPFSARICVDSAPLAERSYARSAGLGWIGKNTCLINEPRGSWFFLGEVLFDFEVEQYGTAPPDRCGSCTSCIDACPTEAIVPFQDHWTVDSNRCISYWTIEAKESAPKELSEKFGKHLFGCDICQDVCPWNRRAPISLEPGFQPYNATPALGPLLDISPEAFRERFRSTPVSRTKATGLARNARIALENQGKQRS